jgi:uncharacterized protein YbdZ (MbtH family)
MSGYVMTGPVLCFLLVALHVEGQYYFDRNGAVAGNIRYECGFSAGMMNCFTDLGGGSTHQRSVGGIDWVNFRAATGFYLLAVFRDALSLRLGYTRGRVSASDADAADHLQGVAGRHGRNLSFRSTINELQFVAEAHPLFFKQYESNKAPYLSPYLVFGIGMFKFEPQAFIDDKWIKLRPLHLEGQGFAEFPSRKEYASAAINFPVGLGLRYELSAGWTVQVEWLHRFLCTDYLDDVSRDYIDPKLFQKYLSPEDAAVASRLANRMREIVPTARNYINGQRGNPKNKDAYFSVEMKIGRRIDLHGKRK